MININELPDSSFAYIAKDGSRHFPFKEKDGQINLPLLRDSLNKAISHEFGQAAKKMKVDEYSESFKGGEGFFTAQVQMTALREQFKDNVKHKPNDEKREIAIPLLVEGWGNEVDNNYYKPKAVIESASYLQSRRKMYLNHPKVETDSRDLRDWAGSIQETWVDTLSDGRKVAMGRVKILDNWLWERCKLAPDEIADSIIGRGKARKGDVNGRSGNIVESIEYVKSCDFVDYGGNVPFGMVSFIENDKQDKNTQEASEMQITEITLGMLKESRQDLISEIEKVAIVEKDKKISELEAKLKEQEASQQDLKKKLDEMQVKEQLQLKEKVVEKALAESKLPVEAKTEIFKGLLMNCSEYKNGDKVVTVEEQVKNLIVDRESIVGKVSPVKGMGDVEKKTEVIAEDQKKFNEGIFGIKEEKKDK